MGEPAGRVRHGVYPAVRCPGCGYLRPDEIPYEPVRVVEVTSRDADGIPDGFREYTLPGAPEARATA